jgi:glycosyltransferase 2 family protein
MNLLRRKRFWLGLLITGIFLYLVLRQIDTGALAQAVLHAQYGWLAPAFAVYILGYLVRALRWKFLLNAVKPLPWTRLLPPLILGFTVNNLLPARAGEFVGAYLVGKREGVSKTAAFATVVMQRVYDGLVMVLLAVVVLAFYRLPGGESKFVDMVNLVIKATAAVFVLVFIALFVMITWKEFFTAWFEKFSRLLPAGLRPKVETLLGSFLEGLAVMRSRRDSLLAFLFSLAAWTGESAAYYFVMRAFGLALPAYAAVMLMAVINLGIMVPSSPGYIGPFEFFGVGTLLLFGVPKSASLPCILVIHALVWLPITLWGFYYMWTLKLSLHEIEGQGAAKPA